MDAKPKPNHDDKPQVNESSSAPQNGEAINHDQPPLLAAHRDGQLSVEAAEQLVRLAEDPSQPVHTGEDLPAADKAALIRKAALPQKTR